MKKFIFLFLLAPLCTGAQTLLTPEEAVRMALLANYDVLVAQNEADSDSILNAPGEAGMLPSVFFNAAVGVNQNNLNQRFTNGNEISSNNAGGTSATAGIALSWTLFDGTRMFVTKQRLEQIEMQGDYQFRSQVLNTTSDVLLAYYDLVRRKQQLAATDEIMKYNTERVKITESRFVGGMGAKTDLLQAKIDLNIQKENRIALQLEYVNAKRAMNDLLARDVLTEFDVPDSIVLSPLANRAELEAKMLSSNPALLAMKTQLNIAKLSYRETRTQYSPRIVGNAGYNFTRAQNTAGFTLYNQAYGWNAGLTLSMPLYLGGSLKRQTQISRIRIMSTEMQLQKATSASRLALLNAMESYDSGNASLALETENEKLARENMNLSLERLRLGQGTALEVAQAQATLAQVLFRLSGLRYEVKAAEINVHRVAADV